LLVPGSMRFAIKLLGIGAALAGAAYATTVIRRRLAIRRLEREADAALDDISEVFFVPIVEEAVLVELTDADEPLR
jgi:hypothetical protein